MGQDHIAQRILKTSDPTAQKRMGNAIRGNLQPWYDTAKTTILPAIKAKFEQNPHLLDYLKTTGQKVILKLHLISSGVLVTG
jgi:predicted NAD-dependent protein-ADP-ribosyltransferase YbiA (DUF1768 family)